MLKLTIINSGAAFDDGNREPEIARLLRITADKIESGVQCGLWPLYDANGNGCGTVDFLAPDAGNFD